MKTERPNQHVGITAGHRLPRNRHGPRPGGFTFLAALIVGLPAAADARAGGPDHKSFTPVARMDTKIVKESSGIVKSPKYPGIFWTHGDSGNPAELFAVKLDGTLVARVPVADAPNLDWEDIASADGFLYVGDIGNNGGWLRVRVVYKFAEPDPYAKDVPPIKPVATYRYRFPEEPFDAEGLVVRGDQIYIARKAAGEASALYRLTPTEGDHYTLTRMQVLRSPYVTGADLSPDGRYLLTVSGVQLVRYPVDEHLALRTDEPVKTVYYPPGDEIEAGCFDGSDVVLTGENGTIYRIAAEDIEQETRFVRAHD